MTCCVPLASAPTRRPVSAAQNFGNHFLGRPPPIMVFWPRRDAPLLPVSRWHSPSVLLFLRFCLLFSLPLCVLSKPSVAVRPPITPRGPRRAPCAPCVCLCRTRRPAAQGPGFESREHPLAFSPCSAEGGGECILPGATVAISLMGYSTRSGHNIPPAGHPGKLWKGRAEGRIRTRGTARAGCMRVAKDGWWGVDAVNGKRLSCVAAGRATVGQRTMVGGQT